MDNPNYSSRKNLPQEFKGMDETELTNFVVANVILFIILLTLICIYRQDWLHKIDQDRIDREIARADKQYKQDVKRFGA
jgi:hypothetical protein